MTKISYIKFTEEQKDRANRVDLERFLLRQGEKLLSSGYEKRLASDHSITILENQWYDHASREGGGPIAFLQTFYGMSFQEAMTTLLDGEQGAAFEPIQKNRPVEKKAFVLPPPSQTMRRMYAYLLKERHIAREVIDFFVRAKLLYESAEPSPYGNKEYHNAVFVGRDEHGIPRHAHKRGLFSGEYSFKRNVLGCEPRYSFHHIGTSDRLYVFEAPIDLLSFVTLYPRDWQQHSYAALCGTAEHAMVWMLEQTPAEKILLCLDHDKAGIEAVGRLSDILREEGYSGWPRLPPQKDWNETVKARLGLPAQPPEKHPQLAAAGPICEKIAAESGRINTGRVMQQIPILLDGCVSDLRWHSPEKAIKRLEAAAALALAVVHREYLQMGKSFSEQQTARMLQERIQPHRNRGSLQKQSPKLIGQFQTILEKDRALGVRTPSEKEELAALWLDFAASCAMAVVRHETEQSEQQESKFEMKLG